MSNRLKEIIRGIVKEIQNEKELEEMTGTGAVAGYDTPNAFAKPGQTGKKNKRLANITGGEVVDDLEEAKDWLKTDVPANSKNALEIKPTATDCSDSGEIADKSGMILAKDDDEASLNENRWLEIKNGDASPKAKMSRGMTSIKQQLGEVEKFVNWYSKIKNENGVKRDDYYKRTHKSLHKIKERLMNLSEKIRTL
jgi:hypothetical protein